MSLIDPEKVKQLLDEFDEKEAVTKAEIYEVERQVAELEARVEESRKLLSGISEDKEVVLGMKAEYGSAEWASIALKVGAELAARGGKRGESFLTGYKPSKSKASAVATQAAPAQAPVAAKASVASTAEASGASTPAPTSTPTPAPAKDKARASQSKLAAIVNRDSEEKAKKSHSNLPAQPPAAQAPQASAPKQAPTAAPYEDSLASVLVQAIGSEPVGSTPAESSSDENPSLFLFSHPKTENKDVDLWSLTPTVSWADLGDEIPPDAPATEPAPASKAAASADLAPNAVSAPAPAPAPAPAVQPEPAPTPEPIPAPLPMPEPQPVIEPAPAPPILPEAGPSPVTAPIPETLDAQPAAATNSQPVTLPASAFDPMPQSGPTPFLDDDEFETSEMAEEQAKSSEVAPVIANLPPSELIAPLEPEATQEKKEDSQASAPAEGEEDVKKINDALRGLFS